MNGSCVYKSVVAILVVAEKVELPSPQTLAMLEIIAKSPSEHKR